MKPLLKISALGSGVIAYRNLGTSKKKYWDPYRMTQKDLSRLPPDMFYVIGNRVRRNVEKYGHGTESFLVALFQAGKLCGFIPSIDNESSSVSWAVTVKHQKQPAEYVRFLALGWRWRRSRKNPWSKTRILLNKLSACPAFLRFVVDTGGNRKVKIYPRPKRNLWAL